ncbi:PIG-L family deacetylase [Actinoplanes sp. CA-030573]|uniref:PIG-L family deacetylase n=1 Tax=Actinoplanes sp. CA-030573 TaxID=3239898 RepID=UPI003D89B225
MDGFRNRLLTAAALVPAAVVMGLAGAGPTSKAAGSAVCTTAGTTMSVVAHQDDDLLFINPVTYADITAGRCVTVVFVTAGDAGRSARYWRGREAGAMAAYAAMAGAADSWRSSVMVVGGHRIRARTLAGHNLRLLFMRLPAGSPHGYPVHHYECLGRLRSGAATTIHAIDGSATYTGASLRAALLDLMTLIRPSVIRTLDYSGRYGDGDHADHLNTAFYTYEAQEQYTVPHAVAGFRGYPVSKRPANQAEPAAVAKLRFFLTYAARDPSVCRTSAACRANRLYAPWFARTYQITAPPNLDGL